VTHWTTHHRAVDVGYLPVIFDDADPRTPQEQANYRYAHGGGWQPFNGFELIKQGKHFALQYPDDPPMIELARADFRGKTLVLFEGSWLGIIAEDGTLEEVSRMD
jgi:hypothetical protein